MTPQDEDAIREWARRQSRPVTLLLSRGQGPADEQISAFCDRFAALAPSVQIRNAPEESFRAPALIIGRHANIAYQAVPEGRELAPFLDALSAAALEKSADESFTVQVDVPAELVLYIAMQCPHCPQTVRRLTELGDRAGRLRMAVVDGMLFAQEADADGIRSVPTLILEGRMRWTGQIDMREVVDQCIRRDPAQLSPASLRQMLEAGDAARAADLMIENDVVFPALIDLLVHERWSVRLGAMVTVEYLADQNPDLAAQLAAPLWERFDHLSEPVQGDVVNVLGQIASDAANDYLRRIASGEYPASVKEAAAEELGEQ